MGHTVKLMAPQFVKSYVKTNKNDAADAEAICEAVRRPNMRFVPINYVEQQAILALHRARQGFVKARTAQGNQIRGMLAEFGLQGRGTSTGYDRTHRASPGPVSDRGMAHRSPDEDRTHLPGSGRQSVLRSRRVPGGIPAQQEAGAASVQTE
jgi:transposase